MPLKITSRWLELDPSAADALTASNIYYSDTETIAAKISENNVQTVLTNPNVDTSVQNGDFVYLGSDGKYYPAIADGTEKQNVVGMYNADNNVIVTTGVVDLSISANYGDWVYLSDTNAGKVQTTETTVNIGIALGNNKVLLASISSGSDDKGLPYKSKLTLSSTYTVPNDYGVVVPEKFEVEDGGELVIEENGVFMIVDNEKPEKVYAFDSERLGNIPAEDYFNYEGATKYSTLNDAVEAVGSANKDLLIKGNVTVDSDLTIPENVNLVFARNGKITVNSGVTLTINGGIQAGLWQIFDGDGVVTGNPKIKAVYPEWFGAKGDGVTDDINSINKALEFAHTIPVQLSSKIYIAGDTIIINSEQKLYGNGKHVTTIKLKDNANTDVIKTYNFDSLTSSNTWLVSNGNIYGFEIKNLSIDGNSANNTTGYGMKIYAKGYRIENVLIRDVAEVGFYSENAAVGGQEGYKDMPESYIDLDIRNTGSHGFQFRGPHDAHIQRLVVAYCGGRGVSLEYSSGVYKGGCDIGIIHIYSTEQEGFYSEVSFRARHIISEGSKKECVVLTNGSQIGILQIYNTDQDNLGYYGLLINDDYNQIDNIKINPSNKSNGMKIVGRFNRIGKVMVIPSYNSSGTGLYIDSTANYTQILEGHIQNYSGDEGVAFHFNGAQGCILNLALQSSETLFKYENSGGRNKFVIRGYATDTEVPFDAGISLLDSDTFDIIINHGETEKYSQQHIYYNDCPIDTSGIQTVTIPHNLITSPKGRKIQITEGTQATVGDYVLDWIRLYSVDDSNITIKYKVGTASTTSGAKTSFNIFASI